MQIFLEWEVAPQCDGGGNRGVRPNSTSTVDRARELEEDYMGGRPAITTDHNVYNSGQQGGQDVAFRLAEVAKARGWVKRHVY